MVSTSSGETGGSQALVEPDGVELRSPRTFLDGTLWPVAAVDVQYREQNNWHTDLSMRAGVQFEKLPLCDRKIQRLLEYCSGHSPTGSSTGRRSSTLGWASLLPVLTVSLGARRAAASSCRNWRGNITSRSSPWQAWVSHQGQRRAVPRSRARATDRGTRVRRLATRRRDCSGHRPRPTWRGRRCLCPRVEVKRPGATLWEIPSSLPTCPGHDTATGTRASSWSDGDRTAETVY
jgi:hypothetical protein